MDQKGIVHPRRLIERVSPWDQRQCVDILTRRTKILGNGPGQIRKTVVHPMTLKSNPQPGIIVLMANLMTTSLDSIPHPVPPNLL